MSNLEFFSNAGGGLNNIAGFLNLALDVNALVNPQEQVREGRRLTQLQILSARSGLPVPRVYGRMRIGGQLIWNDKPEERVTESGGDKGGGRRTPRRRSYRYHMSFAVALCEGEVAHIGRIWADGKLLEQSQYNFRLNNGTPDQAPDPLIEIKMGVGKTPAYRGIAYIVFQDFDLTSFGNRVPQLSFEVFRATPESANMVQAINLLPGATEFGYHPEPHIQILGIARARGENLNAARSRSDWDISMEALETSHPQCRDVALVVAWFGSSLEARDCRIRPGVEINNKQTLPTAWHVAGLARSQAHLVSRVEGRPAFGGTPSDASVIAAIRDLRARGFRVLFYPFIMMDIANQYPWRGRITSSATTATGKRADVARFVNGRTSNDLYCLRGMVRHYAALCARAGGVDAFLLASELKSISRIRAGANDYPFADELISLAQLAREHLPRVKLSYASDWSEYGAYVPKTGAVEFPLDKFWSHNLCDFIGIDAYFPLADWRDGNAHLDARDASEITDGDYLENNMNGGEYYDWYYRDESARKNQARTPITDGLGEAWLYRAKDIKNWWQNAHRPRANNIRQNATAWQPAMKPIWFTEFGCPAVDKGANQPNVFPDSLSVDGGVPYFSNGARDDHIQQAYLSAFTSFYEREENNPTSPVYGEAMVPRQRMYIWAWDARPFPAFPFRLDVWRDGNNWHTGHWLNGRQAVTPLASLVRDITARGGASATLENASGMIEGYAPGTAARFISAREALAPLLQAYALDAISGGARLRISGRYNRAAVSIAETDILADTLRITYAERASQPTRLDLHYISGDNAYEPALATARVSDKEKPVRQVELPLVLASYVADAIAERLLYEARLEGERLQCHLPPRYLTLELGDIIRLQERLWRITRLNIAGHIEIEASAYDDVLYHNLAAQTLPLSNAVPIEIAAPPVLQIMDLPYLPQHQSQAGVPLLAGTAEPWGGALLVQDRNQRWQETLPHPAIMGETRSTLPAAPIGRLDKHNALEVALYRGVLESRPLGEVLGGRNLLAIKTSKGWELVQFVYAELIDERLYRLTHLLRGIKGSEAEQDEALASGAPCVLLDENLRALENPPETLPAEICVDYGVSGLPEDSYAWNEACFAFARVGLRPLAPVHAKRDGNRVHWIRRSRIGGDDFDAVEIPLGEEKERYQLRLVKGAREIHRTQTTRARWYIPTSLVAQTIGQNARLYIAQISVPLGAGSETFIDL